MRVLFVGPLSGYTSYPVVCKGLLQALTSAGFDVDVADTTWDGSPDHTAPILMEEERSIRFLEHKEVARLVKEGESTEANGDVCVVVNPTHHLMGIKDKGYRVAGMFVGDVDKIPGPWLAIMEKLDVVLTPSSWGKQVIQSSGVETDILVCNHGISQIFRIPVLPRLPGRPFIFFHACSAMYFPERKGTPQALEAFSRLVEDGHDVILHLVMGGRTKPMRKMLRETLSKAAIERVRPFWQEGAREPEEIKKSYLATHAGLFPSRAEGFGMCVAHGTHITTREGVVPVQDVCVGTRVLTSDGRWNTVTATKERRSKRLIRIRCQGVPEIALTPEHPVLVSSRGKSEQMASFKKNASSRLCWMPAGDIDETCYLVLRGPSCSDVTYPRLGLLDFAREAGEDVVEEGDFFSLRMSNRSDTRLTAKSISKKIGVSEHAFRRAVQPSAHPAKTHKTRALRRKIRDEARARGYFDQRNWMPRYIDWGPDFCRLLGYYAAEGSVSRGNGKPRSVQFSFSKDTDDVSVRQVTTFLESIGLTVGCYDKRDSRGRNVNCSSSVLASLMVSLCGTGSVSKRLPPKIWSLPANSRAALLEALVRGDGCVTNGSIEYASRSEVLAFQVRDLWLSLGIPASVNPYKMPQCRNRTLSRVKCLGKVRRSSKLIWKVRVQGKYAEQASSTIGIGYSAKRTKTGRRGSLYVPYEGTWLAPVKSVRSGATSKPVYDLQVENDETFVANGVVVHNCPLEMRACGVPVIQTMCTGHADHLDPSLDPREWGITVVRSGPMVEAWGKFGRAPEVKAGDVYEAMVECMENYDALLSSSVAAADGVRAGWAWEETTRPLVQWIRSLPRY